MSIHKFTSGKSSQEKRRYFRINDQVGLSYRVLNSDDQNNDAACVEVTAAHLLNRIDREFNQLINALWLESPTAAKAIGLLNRKIEVLADEVIPHDENSLREKDQQEVNVNISGCGIGFHADQPEPTGQQLELYLTLKPSNAHLRLTGTVVGCDKDEELTSKPYWLRVDFDEHDVDAREQLIQHIMKRQFAKKENDD